MVKLVSTLAAAALFLAATPALAAPPLTFTLTGTDDVSFSLASDASFYNETIGGYNSAIFPNITGTISGMAKTFDFSVFDVSSGGGFQITFAPTFLSDLGPVIFQGPLTHPTFTTGSFHFTDGLGVGAVNDTLTISESPVQAAVPEPMSWCFFLLGFLLLGVVLRRTRKMGRLHPVGVRASA